MLSLKFKYWLKNDENRNLLIIFGIAVVYLLIMQNSGIMRNLSDLLFLMGILHFVVGGARYISNVGLFKTFSYWAYKRRWKKHGPEDGETRPMSLAEYTMNVIWDDMRQKPVKRSLFTGLGLCVVSLLLAAL